ncbi:type VII toxin-antitoxin system MntA family adenylyltransferase antitoxin [Desulfovermiculus halophilus]|uniref:type VII toxin-antitoxin system MntA family adenylyltransferase antitoxin n=1 Tax=Desulfovermiculus halophilus TaxID=339722 RepID=UPI0006848CB1|nr:nucleotidyltransferase domain-containing protein [Desulfovermiculus halophilus]
MVYINSEVKEIADCLEKDERISAAYALGSAVTGRLRGDSDLDIALLPTQGRSFSQMDLLHLSSQLRAYCSRTVDIGILSTHNLIYAKEALLQGECLFCKDQYFHDMFVATALGLYLELRTARREVEHAYTA